MHADLRRPARAVPPTPDEDWLSGGARPVFPPRGTTSSGPPPGSRSPSGTTVLTGGPGTGKTTTVAALLALLAERAELAGEPPLRIALAAPTGKAAARLQQAVRGGGRQAPRRPTERLAGGPAVTLHRLLGAAARHVAPGSGTTATTGCRTTSSWSTRPRWSR